MEQSKYNFWSLQDDGSALLFNGRTGALLSVDPDELPAVRSTLSNGEGAFSDVLSGNGMLVEDVASEVSELLSRRAIPSEVLEVTISPTYTCNFCCEYCYVHFEDSFMDYGTALKVVERISKLADNYKIVNVNWFGGEPLLQWELIEKIIPRIHEACSDCVVNNFVTTNGFGLTKEVASRLHDAGVRHFHITIDGDKRFHDSHRFLADGGPTYDTVLSNLLNLVEKWSDVQCTLRMNLDVDAVEGARATLVSIPEEFRGRIQFNATPIIRNGGTPSESFCRELGKLIEFAVENGYAYYNNIVAVGNRNHCSAEDRDTVHFGPDGRIHKCSPSGKPEVAVGDVFGNREEFYAENRRRWDEASDVDLMCLGCRYLCFCQGGCRVKRIRKEFDCDHLSEYDGSIETHIRILARLNGG